MMPEHGLWRTAARIGIGSLLCVLPTLMLAQPGQPAQMTPAQVIALSRQYEQRAVYFRDMPQFNRDSTLFHYQKARTLLENARPQPADALLDLYAQLGEYAYEEGNDAEGRQLINIAWALAQQRIKAGVKQPLLYYRIQQLRAFMTVETDDPEQALAFFLSAVSLLQADESPQTQARLLKDKGLFYGRYNGGIESQVDDGINDLRGSLHLYGLFGDATNDEAVYTIYKGLLWYHNVKENADSCDYYYNKLAALLPRLKSPFAYNWYYATRGNNLSRRHRFGEAKKLIQKSLDITDRYQLERMTVYPFSLNLMGVIAGYEGRYDEGIAYFVKARDASLANKWPFALMTFQESMAGLYEQKKDYKQALRYKVGYYEEHIKRIQTHTGSNVRENELKISLLKKETQLTRQQAEQRAYQTAVVTAALVAVLLGVILFGLYRTNRTRQRVNRQLETLNVDLATKNSLLDKRNDENELLLKEIHHRVKNNLEVVSSLLALQSARITDPNVQKVMQASRNRVQSMGIIHQKLYQGEQLAAIEMRDYFINLGESVLDSFDAGDRINIDCSMAELTLDIDTAISIGLITNELLTNSLKYAFVGKDSGTIRISLTRQPDDSLLLQVADNGVGKPLNGAATGTGFGTQLVDLLTRQLGGLLTYENQNGTLVKLCFHQPAIA